MTELRGTKWAFTSWREPNIDESKYEYLCWSQEYTPSNGLCHYQGYIEMKKEYTMRYIKSLFKCKEMHLEIARKDKQSNYDYCFKNRQAILTSFDSDNKMQAKRTTNIIEKIFFNVD